jgi:Flp pilus assembly protein TadG
MVEMAIALTALLLTLFGIMDYGRALFTYDAVSNAARLATRYAMVRGSQCQASGCPATQSSIQAYLNSQVPMLDPTQMTVTASWPGAGGCQSAGCPVAVTVSYPFAFVTPLLPQITIPMSSTSQMAISQ